MASLKSLNKNDVVEVRALNRPPEGVRLVIDAVSIMRGVKPKKIAGEKVIISVITFQCHIVAICFNTFFLLH